MKKFVCALVALSFVLGTCAIVTAGDKDKKAEVKKQEADKAKADKPKAEKPKAEKPKREKPKKTPQDRFNAVDTDGNKKISLAEFVGKREGDKKAKAEAIFKKRDKDSSGDLTLDEVTPAKKPAKEKKPQQKKPAGEKKPPQKKPEEKKPAK